MVAMAGNDETNQSVAIGGTVLNPSLRIIARVHTPMAQANLKSFRNIELINPYETFGVYHRSCWRRQKRGPSDCLPQTQVPAKAQAEV